ncbi:MAG: isochorismatase family protein [Acetobacteraceae bacterium]|nr:isochorismatase family protein [Acetobacteraceae bacterium]
MTAHATTQLMTATDPLLLLFDQQPGPGFAVKPTDREALLDSLVALAATARAFELPAVAPIERTTMDSSADANVVTAVEATGRKALLLAGLLSKARIAFTALSALDAGYTVRVGRDACGGSSPVAHETALQLIARSGMRPRTWLQVLLELQRDWTRQATYMASTDIIKAHAGAYAIGLNYAKAMLA